LKGYRVAVVAPVSTPGRRVREALVERQFPITELRLFESEGSGESRLTEFEGEVLITQPLDPDLFPRLDVIFFSAEAPRAPVRAAVEEGVLTILLGPSPGLSAPLAAAGLNDKSLPAGTRLVRIPEPSALLLGTLLAALGRGFVVRQAVASLLVPAMELGQQAAEELQQQAINLLSFRPLPKEIFGDQLAFNVNLPPEELVSPAEERLQREIRELSEVEAPVAVFLMRAGIFHGYALALWVSLEGEPALEEVVEKLRRASLLVHRTEGAKPTPSPVSVAELGRIQVGRLRRDPANPGAFWIWAVADLSAVDPANHAVRLAEKLLGVSARRK
jgi:aspartate-semialdehyde dehydrogenase